MIEHIVLMQWKPDATPGQIEQVMTGLRGMRGQIPGILDLTCGENFSDRAQGYTHALVVRFTDRAALDAYGPHPVHRHVVDNFIKPIRGEFLSLDFVIE
jgi:hypothetical protein